MTGAGAGGPELVLTDEQLTILAATIGEPDFPYVRAPQLTGDGWEAVARGVVARGLLSEQSPARASAEFVLGVVLSADSSLRLTFSYAPGEGDGRHEVLWLRGDTLVCQSVLPGGLHRFLVGDRGAVDATLAALVALPDGAAAADGPPQALERSEWVEAIGVLRRDGAPAAAGLDQGASGFVAALADARQITNAEGRRDVNDDLVEGQQLTLVQSSRYGLWLVRGEPSSDGVVLQPVCVEAAREQVRALLS